MAKSYYKERKLFEWYLADCPKKHKKHKKHVGQDVEPTPALLKKQLALYDCICGKQQFLHSETEEDMDAYFYAYKDIEVGVGVDEDLKRMICNASRYKLQTLCTKLAETRKPYPDSIGFAKAYLSSNRIQPKRPRGRPRKPKPLNPPPKRPRGRPRKNAIIENINAQDPPIIFIHDIMQDPPVNSNTDTKKAPE